MLKKLTNPIIVFFSSIFKSDEDKKPAPLTPLGRALFYQEMRKANLAKEQQQQQSHQ